MTYDEAEVIALNMLTFLASGDKRLAGFLRMTGTDLQTLAASATEPGFLSGVLHYVLQNESLLTEFAAVNGLDPNLPRIAQEVLDARVRRA